MRKPLAVLVAAGLAAGVIALPAGASKGKKKTIEGTFSAQLLPFPKLAAVGDPIGVSEPGCNAGEEGVHKHTEPFEAPAAGTLTVRLAGFTGDWDLHLTDETGHAVLSSQRDQTEGAQAEEELFINLKPKNTIGMTICNWAGGPEAEAHYVFELTGIGKKKGHSKR